MRDRTAAKRSSAVDDFAQRYYGALAEVIESVYASDAAALNRTIRGAPFRDLVCRTLGFEIANFHFFDPLTRDMKFFRDTPGHAVDMPWFSVKGPDGHGGFIVEDVSAEQLDARRREQQRRGTPGGEQLTADICRRLLTDQPGRWSRREAERAWLLITEGEILTFALEFLILTEYAAGSTESPAIVASRCWNRMHEPQHFRSMAGRRERSLEKLRAWLAGVLTDDVNYKYLWDETPTQWFIAERDHLLQALEPSKTGRGQAQIIAVLGECVMRHVTSRTDDPRRALDTFYGRSRVNPVMELIHGTHNIVFFKLTALVDVGAGTTAPQEFDAYLLGTFFSRTRCEERAREIQGLFRLVASKDLHRFTLTSLSNAQQRITKSEAVMQTLSSSLFIHEMTNHLKFVISLCEELQDELVGDPRASTFVPRLSMAIDKIEEGIRVVRVARHLASAGAVHRDFTVRCNVTETVNRALRGLSRSEGVRMDTHFPGVPILANFHEDSLRIVLENILNNAVESMTGGGVLTLRIVSTLQDVTVEVSDSGAGMAPAVSGRAFEPHFTTKPRGLGMGLFICKSIVELQGGSIELASEEGKGTTFRVRLPCALDEGGHQ